MYPTKKHNFYVSFTAFFFAIACIVSGFILGQRWTENSEMYLVYGSYQHQKIECEMEVLVPCEVIIYGIPKTPFQPDRDPGRPGKF